MKFSVLTVVALSSAAVLQSNCMAQSSTASCVIIPPDEKTTPDPAPAPIPVPGPTPGPSPAPVDPSNKNLPFWWQNSDQQNWNPYNFNFNTYRNDQNQNPGNYNFNFDYTNKNNNFLPSWLNFQNQQFNNKPNVYSNINLPLNLNFDSWSSSSNNLQPVQPISFNLNDYQRYLASKNTGNGNQPNINSFSNDNGFNFGRFSNDNGFNFGQFSNNNQGGSNFGQLFSNSNQGASFGQSLSSGSFNGGGIGW